MTVTQYVRTAHTPQLKSTARAGKEPVSYMSDAQRCSASTQAEVPLNGAPAARAAGSIAVRKRCRRARLAGVLADARDEEGHAEREDAGQRLLVEPRELERGVEADEALAREEARREAVLVLRLVDEELQELLDELAARRLRRSLHRVGEEAVRGRHVDGLAPLEVLLVELCSDAAERDELVLLHAVPAKLARAHQGSFESIQQQWA